MVRSRILVNISLYCEYMDLDKDGR
jgi:hypothetical protein